MAESPRDSTEAWNRASQIKWGPLAAGNVANAPPPEHYILNILAIGPVKCSKVTLDCYRSQALAFSQRRKS